MEIKRKLACKYLSGQYDKAKKYLIKETNNNKSNEELNIICERVRRVGIAYAQTRYCVFFNNGAWGENIISRINDDNKVTANSEYKEFIDEMERYIHAVVN